ncbi:MAG: bifunctional ornithine acetyltransferase/N-acetylglutamate synthase, partial [bacterium]|nr:bifunctional ornithine acetyltransferase/N-acetylglutamate synthase [bacterium]
AAAAPVADRRGHPALGPIARAVVLNSGSPNAGTRDRGGAAANTTAAAVAAEIGCATEEVLVCSTGAIGPSLPMDRILLGITEAVSLLDTGTESGSLAAAAIMTTDTVPKETVFQGGGFTVGGMAKGAGMVRPDMATMLVVVTTDAAAEPRDLDLALRSAVEESFHALNIDGCPSTNDTVILLAS